MLYGSPDRYVQIGIRALFALLCLVLILMLWNQHSRPHRDFSSDALTGLDKYQVTQRLGLPDRVIRSRQGLSADMGRDPESVSPVDREVLVYPSHNIKMYVFIGKDYRVTHTEMSVSAKR